MRECGLGAMQEPRECCPDVGRVSCMRRMTVQNRFKKA